MPNIGAVNALRVNGPRKRTTTFILSAKINGTGVNRIGVNGRITTPAAVGPPIISVDPTDPVFTMYYGTADDAPSVLDVFNAGGGGVFGSLVAQVTYGSNGSGWLAAVTTLSAGWQLSRTSSDLAGALWPGTYTATVRLIVPSAPTVDLTTTFQVIPTALTPPGSPTAQARSSLNAVVPQAIITWSVDRTDLVSCASSTGICTAIKKVTAPTVITLTATSHAHSATTQFTLYPKGYTP